MAQRTITDAGGRAWTCTSADLPTDAAAAQGQDVVLTCVTPSVDEPVEIRVGWQWERMSENGLARLIAQASPAPRR
jgi:hypothetical protein